VDSDEFKFSFAGRQGGHLILESAYGINLAGFDLESLLDVQTEWGVDESPYSFAEVRRLYRTIVQMDSDFSAEHVRDSMLHAIAFARYQWEEERAAELSERVAEAEQDKATALALIGELKAARLACPVSFPAIRQAIRKAIANAIRDRREARIEAARLMFPSEAEELFGKAC
jgi:hypothetical protein